MGKMLSGMIAVIFMTGGLTALTIGGATADPYPGSVNTNCHADDRNSPRVGDPAKVRFRVGTDGNGAARGRVFFDYERRSNGAFVKEFVRSYDGPGWENYEFHGLPRGDYRVRVFFDSRPAGSVYQNCRTTFRQVVRPAR